MIGAAAGPAHSPVPASPLDDFLGTRVTHAEPDRVVVEVDVDERLHQPFGAVHGGVYALLAETAASVGGAFRAPGPDGHAVGVSNHTDFLRPVAGGRLTATGSPLQQGRTLQLWRVEITDGAGRLVAHSTVKLYNVAGRSG